MKLDNLQTVEKVLEDWEEKIEQIQKEQMDNFYLKKLYIEKEEILLDLNVWFFRGVRELRSMLLEKEITINRKIYLDNIEETLTFLFRLLEKKEEEIQE